MTPYKNLSGKSNVESYSFTTNSITVKFRDSKTYIYSIAKNPLPEVEKMINLAIIGSGLGTMLATKPHHPHDISY